VQSSVSHFQRPSGALCISLTCECTEVAIQCVNCFFFLTVNCQAPLSVNEENGSDSVLTLRSQTLTVSSKTPRIYWPKTRSLRQAQRPIPNEIQDGGALLEKARTYFDENPPERVSPHPSPHGEGFQISRCPWFAMVLSRVRGGSSIPDFGRFCRVCG